MVKTTFMERLERVMKFYDFTYHVHKSTFKGLASFYEQYMDVEKQYANKLLKLTKQINDYVPQFKKQNPTTQITIKQLVACIETCSQLHYNYSERLEEVSGFYTTEYTNSKKKKEKEMRVLGRKKDDYEQVREKEKKREVINQKEKDLCGVLYEGLDSLVDAENDRIHKIKEQTIIYFSLLRKICEKELEKANQFNLKLVKQDFNVQHKSIFEVAQILRDQYNGYGGAQLHRKEFDLTQTMSFNRSSLRASLALRQRKTRAETYKTELRATLERYESYPLQLMFETGDIPQNIGIFTNDRFTPKVRRQLSRQINSSTLKLMFYEMFEGYWKAIGLDSDGIMMLQVIKAGMKITSGKSNIVCKNIKEFWAWADDKNTNYKWHGKFLQLLSEVYEDHQEIILLFQLIQKRYEKENEKKETSERKPNRNSQRMQEMKPDRDSPEFRKQKSSQPVLTQSTYHSLTNSKHPELCFLVNCSCISMLLDGICIIRDKEQILIDDYCDVLKMIAVFGQEYLKIDRKMTILLWMKKVEKIMEICKKRDIEELQSVINQKYFKEKNLSLNFLTSQDISSQWFKSFLNNVTKSILNFPSRATPLLNQIKFLLILEKLQIAQLYQERFKAQDHLYFSIKCAGFVYLKEIDETRRLSGEAGEGGERLKFIVESLEELDIDGVVKEYFEVAADQMSGLLGVGKQMALTKMIEQFTYATLEIINANLKMIAEEQGTDRDGYALRLGIILAKLDMHNPLPIQQYEYFFKVLEKYLTSTEEDYDQMLEHSRKTELWIMEENANATANCVDFCSLLYKPFEFLLISLKKLEEGRKTQYVNKYTQFIKLRLNTTLKTQIIKYINFLYESLTTFNSTEPEILIKPKHVEKIALVTVEVFDKEKYSFKQITRRLFNLLFLKDQLEEMICQFLDQDLYKSIDYSIFNLEGLQKKMNKYPQSRDILLNVREIVKVVLANEEKIIRKTANITVFHCMKRIFSNLYYQQGKNALEEFFSSSGDYKLSEFTFVKAQNEIQQWLTVIIKNIPDQFMNSFYEQFLTSIYIATRAQTLNSTKMKLPLPQTQVINYLDSDATFLATLLKQKYLDEDKVVAIFHRPYKKLLDEMGSTTSQLMNVFEDAMMKDDKVKCREILVLLSLRVKDDKAEEFIKKYKSIALK